MSTNLAEVQTENNIGLTVDPDTFAKFVLDFLGHKENLSYKSTDNFLINLEDIAQFNHLIKGKLSYQKNVFLEHFSINFGYTDGTFRKIHGEQSLIDFLETRSININSVSLNWKIIVKFDNSPTIETQEINLLFVKNFDKALEDKNPNRNDEISLIDLTIDHTNQSWALDILNAFKEKIEEVKIQPPKISVLYNKIKDSPSLVLVFIVYIIDFSPPFTFIGSPLISLQN